MERAGRPRHRSHNPRGEGERAGSERINAFGVSCIARLGGRTLTPNSVDGVEKSVDNYCWQKAAAASPQFARDQPKYDRAKRHNYAHLQMDDASDASNPADLYISGPVARKDGSPGKRSYARAKLFSDEWRLTGRARQDWLDKLREFWP